MESQKELAKDLRQKMDPETQKQFLSSASSSASSFLTAIPTPALKLDDRAFINGIYMRCGVQTHEHYTTVIGDYCPLCHNVFHEGHQRYCTALKAGAIERHDQVKHIVFEMVHNVPGSICKLEARLGVRHERRQHDIIFGLTTDAVPETPFSRHFIDVAVGDTLAPSYATRALKGEVPDKLEETKVTDYGAWPMENHGTLWPFGMSCSGQLGTTALKLMDKLKEEANKAKKPFYKKWGCARFAVTALRAASKMGTIWAHKASGRFCLMNSFFSQPHEPHADLYDPSEYDSIPSET